MLWPRASLEVNHHLHTMRRIVISTTYVHVQIDKLLVQTAAVLSRVAKQLVLLHSDMSVLGSYGLLISMGEQRNTL